MRSGSKVSTSYYKVVTPIKLLVIPSLSAGGVLENDSIVLMVQFIFTDRGTNPGHYCVSPDSQ